MALSEAERHEFYNLAEAHIGGRFAELLMSTLPSDPDRLATKDDLALARSELRNEMSGIRTEMADLRTDMADLRTELKTEMAGLRADMADLRAGVTAQIHDEITVQTRLLVVTLVGSVTALAIANTVTAALTG